MPNAKARAAAALLLLSICAASVAQDRQFTPREDYEEFLGRPKPTPEIPRELRGIVVEARPERLVVQGLGGQRIPVSLEWFEPGEFETFADGRFLGFRYWGNEEIGYVLVDRRMSGEAASLSTGNRPLFSPDGRYIAAAELSQSGFGNLNGVALFEVLADRTVRRFLTDVLPRHEDLRVDRWVRPDCAAFSAIELENRGPDVGDVPRATGDDARSNFSLEVGEEIAFRYSYSEPPCVPQPAP